MERVLASILHHLDQLTITGKDAERMAAIKSMVRDLRKLFSEQTPEKEEKPE